MKIQLNRGRTCFAAVSASFAEEMRKTYPTGAVVLKLLWAERHAYVSWNGGKITSSGQSNQPVMEISETLAACLGLAAALASDPYLPVLVHAVDEAEYPSTLELEPCTSDDWELIELHAAYLESELLRQVCVVFAAQMIPIWVHGNKLIRLRVINLDSKAPQRLGTNTEVVIPPRPRPRQTVEGGSSTPDIFTASPPLRVDPLSSQPPLPAGAVALHPTTYGALHGAIISHRPNGHRGSEVVRRGLLGDRRLVWVHDDSPQAPRHDAKGMQGGGRAVAAVMLLESVGLGCVVLSKALRLQLQAVPLESCVRVRVLSRGQLPQDVRNVTLHPVSWAMPARTGRDDERDRSRGDMLLRGGNGKAREWTADDLWPSFSAWVREESEVLGGEVPITDGLLITLRTSTREGTTTVSTEDVVTFSITLPQPENPSSASVPAAPGAIPYALLASPPPTISLGSVTPRSWLWDRPGAQLACVGGRDAQLQACLEHLAPPLVPTAAIARVRAALPPPGPLLVYGQPCSGKTALCRALTERLRCAAGGAAVASVWVDCRSLRGHKMRDVLGELSGAMARARALAPSLLVLDDMDALAPAESDDGGDANLQAAEIADHLRELLRRQARTAEHAATALGPALSIDGVGLDVLGSAAVACSVAVVMTAADPNLLHTMLRQPGLGFGLDAVVEVPSLDAKAREAVLAALLTRHCGEGGTRALDMAGLAVRMEGCTPADIETVVTRALHSAAARELVGGGRGSVGDTIAAPVLSTQPCITSADVQGALQGFTPASLRGARLFSSEVTWADIGGLDAVKQEIRDIMEIPVRFARLYQRMPMRLPTGVLLYGPPGCGKTLLAGAVAKECGLNFVSVKGPEVLDKYIGASEQAVRTLFARASAAAPCVLFFDEFEALAPRRGNDNTGVTDRVVNQLLTFLDGVEGRTGVYVMGATSRPDMVDPALLRPGRLDRQLYCGFPDAHERVLILEALSRRMEMTAEAKKALKAVAMDDQAELFTGADLQAVLSTAQLDVVHERLAAAASDKGGNRSAQEAQAPILTEHHLWAAYRATRPSMSPKDRAQFQAIYDKFRKSRKADFRPASATDDGTPRTALM